MKIHKIEIGKKITNYFASTTSKNLNEEDIPYYEKKCRNGKTTKIKCPSYKVIAGSTFGVDSFRFGIIEGVTHYFLTHFHADHYVGLKKQFHKPIFLSDVTAKLVSKMINVDSQYLNIVHVNKTFIINDVEITALDANHCPGALMFFFKLTNGKTILHTGDFRACPEMESEPVFWNNDIDIVYLDTTYFSSRYVFIPQWQSIKIAQEVVAGYGERFNWDNILIVCGSYLIGKEKIWINIASTFNLKVWMDKNRRKALECYANENILSYLVEKETDATLHILPINKCHYNWLLNYLNQFDNFEHILALVPSGWQKNIKPIVRGHITIIGIEYSEHSSYSELTRFISYIKPKKIISTVPISGKDLNKTTVIPNTLYKYDVAQKRQTYQQSLKHFFKATPMSTNIPSNNAEHHKSDDVSSNIIEK